MQLQCEKEAIKGQKKWVVPWKSWTWIMKTLVFLYKAVTMNMILKQKTSDNASPQKKMCFNVTTHESKDNSNTSKMKKNMIYWCRL